MPVTALVVRFRHGANVAFEPTGVAAEDAVWS
jgi:hypothetical protein